jgi:hypothetical protein
MYECKHGCGYKHDKRGTMNLHESMHCKTLRTTSSTKKTTKNPSGCDCSDGGNWRLLTPNEKNYVLINFNVDMKEVCETCKELR